jgi:hypothetical protein
VDECLLDDLDVCHEGAVEHNAAQNGGAILVLCGQSRACIVCNMEHIYISISSSSSRRNGSSIISSSCCRSSSRSSIIGSKIFIYVGRIAVFSALR